MDANTIHGMAQHMTSGTQIDALEAAIASASLPILVRPSRLDGSAFLDGGVVANLPAGQVLNHGSAGGGYVVCVIPRAIGELNPRKAIDRRVLDFLCTLRKGQADNRDAALRGVNFVPPHTFDAILVVTPRSSLRSTLISFEAGLLREEFSVGQIEARALADCIVAFERGDDDALDGYLLELVLEGLSPPTMKSTLGFWRFWVNTRWH